MKLISLILSTIVILGTIDSVFAGNQFNDEQINPRMRLVSDESVAAYPRPSLVDDEDEGGWIVEGCTFSYDQADCESYCSQYVNTGEAQASRCEQRLRCTGDSGNGWACMILPNGN